MCSILKGCIVVTEDLYMLSENIKKGMHTFLVKPYNLGEKMKNAMWSVKHYGWIWQW
jgi:hypothetical protein